MKGTRRGWWHYASGYDAHDPGARWEAAAAAGGFEMDGGSAIVLNVPMGAKRATSRRWRRPSKSLMAGKTGGKELREEALHKRDTRGRERQDGGGVGVGWWVVGGGQRRGEGEVGDEVAKPRRGREMEGRGAKERRREGRSQRARAQGHGRDQCLCPLAVGANAKPTEPYC